MRVLVNCTKQQITETTTNNQVLLFLLGGLLLGVGYELAEGLKHDWKLLRITL